MWGCSNWPSTSRNSARSGKPRGATPRSPTTWSTTRSTRSLRRCRSEVPVCASSTSATRATRTRRARWPTSTTARWCTRDSPTTTPRGGSSTCPLLPASWCCRSNLRSARFSDCDAAEGERAMRRFTTLVVAVVGISFPSGVAPRGAVAHEGGEDWIGILGWDYDISATVGAEEVEAMLATTAPATPASDDHSPALCGLKDTPETGIQGDVPLADQQSGRAAQGYNCGLALVGYNNLGGQGAGDLAWSDYCGYVKSPGGIKVVDLSNPTAPTVVGFLPINVQSENIHAVTTSERALLVAAQGNGPGL